MQDSKQHKRHNFSYILPRILAEKFSAIPSLEPSKAPPKKPKKKHEKDINKDSNKQKQKAEVNHKTYHLKPNENFSELFWKLSSKCPRQKMDP
jgi:hypothetical protein